MEPVGLAIGVVGLAGLFTTCLDTIDRIDSYREFGEDSRSLAARFNADRLRFERWGRAVGLEDGKLSSKHPALNDQRICAAVVELITIIQKLCSDADRVFNQDALLRDIETDSSSSGFSSKLRSQNTPAASKKQKIAWALRGKTKRVAQIEVFGNLVQKLYELVPPDEKDPRPTNGQPKQQQDDVMDSKSWAMEIQQMLAKVEEEMEVEVRRDIHTWLGADEPNDLYDDSTEKRVEGTCDWILSRPAFMNWLTSSLPRSTANLLWVNAPAGFGKTVTCARVTQYLHVTLQTPVAHFFLSSNFASRNDPFSVMRSWIAQLGSQNEVAFELIRKRRVGNYGKVATKRTIIELFNEILEVVPHCTFVLDGLDECAGVGQDSSVTGFLHSLGQAIANKSSRVIIFSRDEPEIRASLQDDLGDAAIEYRITVDDVLDDIASYSKHVVNQKLSNKNETIKEDISQRLTDRCDGQFLWVRMQADSLRKGMNKMQLQRAISDTPTGLTQIYERNWASIQNQPSSHRERALALLQWASFSLRPLAVDEITEAVLIQDGLLDIPVEELPDSIDTYYIQSEILGYCGSLVEVRKVAHEDRPDLMTVHLAHFSVKQFLLSKLANPEGYLRADSTLLTSYEELQNAILAKKCVQYLSFSKTWQATTESGTALLTYASGSWHIHTHLAAEKDRELVEMINQFFDIGNANWLSWCRWFDGRESKYDERVELDAAGENLPNPLYYAARLGLGHTVKYLLARPDCDIDGKGLRGTTALSISCLMGYASIVKDLLDAGSNLSVGHDMGLRPLFQFGTSLPMRGLIVDEETRGWTPLNLALYNGHMEVVKLLLERAKGQDLTVAAEGKWNSLQLASLTGNLDIVKLLFEEVADLPLASEDTWTPLHHAAETGHLDVARFLLEKGADVSCITNSGDTPLHYAVGASHLAMAKLLLQQGADVSISNSYGSIPIHLAAANGHVDLVELLLQWGSDVSRCDGYGWRPLHVATGAGHLGVIRLLLEKTESKVLDTDEDGNTPLHIAAAGGHLDVVKLLLGEGANVSDLGENGNTSLHMAAARGHLDVLKLLLEQGADVSMINDLGHSPLHAAAGEGHLDIVKLLLETGVDLTIVSIRGLTALGRASHNGHLDVVKLLLEKTEESVEVDDLMVEQNGLSLMHLASQNEDTGVLQLLLNRCPGSIPGLFDATGRTPLHYAAGAGRVSPVRTLIENGQCPVNAMDWCGATALSIAARNGYEQTVEVLLSVEGIDVMLPDKFGRAPAWWARGYPQILRLLRLQAERQGFTISQDELPLTDCESADLAGFRCDGCSMSVYAHSIWFVCGICSHGDFDICQSCYDMGVRCLDASHSLVQHQI